MRHNALFRRFISALTRGGPGGLPRPIEVHAHDPLRYVGDMLGWLHQVRHSSTPTLPHAHANTHTLPKQLFSTHPTKTTVLISAFNFLKLGTVCYYC